MAARRVRLAGLVALSGRRLAWANRALLALSAAALVLAVGSTGMVVTAVLRGAHPATLAVLPLSVPLAAWSGRTLPFELRLARALRRSRRAVEA